MIYLDNNATTRLDPAVADAMAECHAQRLGNPSSQHRAGRRARRVLEDARHEILTLLGGRTEGSQPDRCLFTSGGTEANNLALLGAPVLHRRLIISSLEHPSVTGAAELLRQRGHEVLRLPADSRGVTSLEPLGEWLERGVDVVSVMLASNETGVLQPVGEVARRCPPPVVVHTDAVQAAGKVAIDFRALGVSTLSVAAHKFHGPVGIGVLLMRHEVTLQPRLLGGFQQEGLRPGTEAVALAVGMAQALRIWTERRAERAERMERQRERFEQAVRAAYPAAVVIGQDAPRLPNTSCIAFPGLDRQALFMALDMHGVACSTGSACASGSSEPSPALLAMHLPNAVVHGALRFSLGADTTDEEIEEAIARVVKVLGRLGSRG